MTVSLKLQAFRNMETDDSKPTASPTDMNTLSMWHVTNSLLVKMERYDFGKSSR